MEEETQINAEHFRKQMKQALDKMDLVSVLPLLKNLQYISTDIANQCRRVAIEEIQNVYKGGIEDNYIFEDVDVVLEVLALSLTSTDIDGKDMQILGAILQQYIKKDARYTLMMFRAKPLMIQSGEQQDNLQTCLRKLKLLSHLPLFLPSILQSQPPLFSDYLTLLTLPKSLFHSLPLSPLIPPSPPSPALALGPSEQNQQILLILKIYLRFCERVLQGVKGGKGEEGGKGGKGGKGGMGKEGRDRVGRVIGEGVGVGVFGHGVKGVKAVQEEFGRVVNGFKEVLEMFEFPLSWQNLYSYPDVMLISILKHSPLPHTLPPEQNLWLHCKLVLHLCPSSTRESPSPHLQSLQSLREEIVVESCRLLEEGVVVGERVGGREGVRVELVYKALAMYMGYVGENGRDLFQRIKKVLKLENKRYKQCPILPIKIWSNILKSTPSTQTLFRTLPLSFLKSTLISFKPSILSQTFQSHSHHTHYQVFYIIDQILLQQLEIVLKMENTKLDCEYIGHIISLVIAYQIIKKFYLEKYKQPPLYPISEPECLSSNLHNLQKKLSSIPKGLLGEDGELGVEVLLARIQDMGEKGEKGEKERE